MPTAVAIDLIKDARAADDEFELQPLLQIDDFEVIQG